MASLEDIRKTRLEKLSLLRKSGMDPYPTSSTPSHTLEEANKKFSLLAKKKGGVTLVGRILSLRPHGALIFFNFNDGTGTFQVLFKKDETEQFDLFLDVADIGDIVEVKGTLFLTKRKENTIQVKKWRMLAKSLRPLPEKWHGLQDIEERFRRRYLDLLLSGEVKERFHVRSRIITELRAFLDKAGFIEVETPILQHLAGGASALPFKTHHNALDIDLFLRIAPELFLKKLLIGGFKKVYEIGRNFRNEGIDVTHNPEFTMLEYYEAYSDARQQMSFAEKFLKNIVKKIAGKSELVFDEDKIDFSKNFTSITFFDLLKRYAHIERPESITREELSMQAERQGVKVEKGDSIEKIMDSIYKKTCRPKLLQPTIITEYPVNYLPLAKKIAGRPTLVDAFQIVIGGLEIVKAFSELNDPIDQRERFGVQEANLKAGDAEAQRGDEEFLEAMEYGIPPAGGVGIGIDRLVMLLTNQKNIREVILFPTLRPR
ncbi:MAG: lysine--tRNA ligase [bacterium]|nr:lysine--tRNA ligase [bacterium]